MTLTPPDAARALAAIEHTQARTHISRGYEHGANYLLLWGVIWMVGYTITDLSPRHASLAWTFLPLLGLAAGMALRRRQGKAAQAWRYGAASLILFGFAAATMILFHPRDPNITGAFAGLLVGTCYLLMGLYRGLRWAIAGALLVALSLGGYAWLPAHFALWMAVVGGGGLVLAGLWLRQA